MKLIVNYPEKIFELVYNLKDGRNSLKDFGKIIDIQVQEIEEKDKKKFKGDMFEIFAEIFFKAFKNDPSIGLVNYEPIDIGEDYGVDGKGINANGDEVAVQVKYRSNPKTSVTYNEIAKTYTSGELSFGLDLKKKNTIYVFTNAFDVTPPCKTVFGNIIKVLNRDGINHYIQNNESFWKFFYEEVYNYLNE